MDLLVASFQPSLIAYNIILNLISGVGLDCFDTGMASPPLILDGRKPNSSLKLKSRVVVVVGDSICVSDEFVPMLLELGRSVKMKWGEFCSTGDF